MVWWNGHTHTHTASISMQGQLLTCTSPLVFVSFVCSHCHFLCKATPYFWMDNWKNMVIGLNWPFHLVSVIGASGHVGDINAFVFKKQLLYLILLTLMNWVSWLMVRGLFVSFPLGNKRIWGEWLLLHHELRGVNRVNFVNFNRIFYET